MSSKWFSGFLPTAKQAVLWVLGMLLTAIAGAVVASYVNRTDNLDEAFRSQQLTQLQNFQASGMALDTNFGKFNDALSDRAKIAGAREQLRAAIAQHAADAFTYQDLMGNDAARVYMEHLGHFRDLVDDATAPVNAIPMAQAGINLITERRKIVAAVERKIGVDPSKRD